MPSLVEQTIEYEVEGINEDPSQGTEEQSLNFVLLRVLESVVASFNDTFSRISGRCEDCLTSHFSAMEANVSLASELDFETTQSKDIIEASNQLR